jgi:1-deoxy-D-xylulose-5-phosphate reductoisomerase
MMNKGLEVIEASRLFGVPGERVQILVHPQSIAHGMIVFTDGSVKIQAAAPDMRLPIGYALGFPDRLDGRPSTSSGVVRSAPAHPVPADTSTIHGASQAHHDEVLHRHPELVEGRPLPAEGAHPDPLVAAGAHPEATALRYDFERPDAERFPCVRLAYEALQAGGTMPAVLSAANEIAVSAFVEGEIRFGQIPQVIRRAMAAASPQALTLDGVRQADRDAREHARAAVDELRARIEV